MKKSFMKAVVVAAAVCMLAACGGKTEETKPPETPVETTVAETTVAETTPAETTAADTAAEEIKTIKGEIIDAAMSTIIIKTEDGTELIFNREDAEVDLKNGMDVGNSVVLEYTGEIVGEDTNGTTVLKIWDKK